MNKLILLAFIFIGSTNLYGQSKFKIENTNSLVWYHVYQIDVATKDLFSFLEASGHFSNITKTDSTFTGSFDRIKADYKSVGVSQMTVPMAYIDGVYAGGVSVKVRDGRYRVRLINMEVKTDVNTAIYSTMHLNDKLSDAFIKNGKFKKVFDSKIGPALQNSFNKIFYFTESDTEW